LPPSLLVAISISLCLSVNNQPESVTDALVRLERQGMR
jgi:hypothetical protein